MGWFIPWIALCIVTGFQWKNKDRNFWSGFFLSFLLSPLVGLIAGAIIKETKSPPNVYNTYNTTNNILVNPSSSEQRSQNSPTKDLPPTVYEIELKSEANKLFENAEKDARKLFPQSEELSNFFQFELICFFYYLYSIQEFSKLDLGRRNIIHTDFLISLNKLVSTKRQSELINLVNERLLSFFDLNLKSANENQFVKYSTIYIEMLVLQSKILFENCSGNMNNFESQVIREHKNSQNTSAIQHIINIRTIGWYSVLNNNFDISLIVVPNNFY